MIGADSSLSGHKVAALLDQVAADRSYPKQITVDKGTEFYSKAMDSWAYQHGVLLDFIRPGRPMENGYIERFNGRLRDECPNGELFLSLVDAREKLEAWRPDYNEQSASLFNNVVGNRADLEFPVRPLPGPLHPVRVAEGADPDAIDSAVAGDGRGPGHVAAPLVILLRPVV